MKKSQFKSLAQNMSVLIASVMMCHGNVIAAESPGPVGIIKTMGAISQPPEYLGALIGSALVGTFLDGGDDAIHRRRLAVGQWHV